MECRQVIFSSHTVRRLFERAITTEEVREVIASGEAIGEYPDDRPFPCKLILGWVKQEPLHIVLGIDQANGVCVVVTAYPPDPLLWEPDFKTRRK